MQGPLANAGEQRQHLGKLHLGAGGSGGSGLFQLPAHRLFQVADRMCAQWLANQPTYRADLLAEDVVIETPFAAPGRPTRTEGKQQVLEYTQAGRAAFPVRFDDCRHVVVHETADPEVIVVEYELVGTHTVTGVVASAPFIGVLRARNGKLVHWREYQHTLAIAQAVGQA